jgi:hypothetical protein
MRRSHLSRDITVGGELRSEATRHPKPTAAKFALYTNIKGQKHAEYLVSVGLGHLMFSRRDGESTIWIDENEMLVEVTDKDLITAPVAAA